MIFHNHSHANRESDIPDEKKMVQGWQRVSNSVGALHNGVREKWGRAMSFYLLVFKKVGDYKPTWPPLVLPPLW